MTETLKKIDFSGITPQSVATVVVAIIAAINIILRMLGMEQVIIPDDQVYDLVSSLFLIGSIVYTSYKNFNVSTASQKAQEVTDLIKTGELLISDVDKMIDTVRERNKEEEIMSIIE